ncbi:MAG: hypothetical protein KKD35_02205 [Elusimicrobia bacterium]|nr:hypothetical protein [Elusimicrobiota bacterium]
MFELKFKKMKWGLILIAIGSVIWAGNYGLVSISFSFSRDWPIMLIAFGLLGIWKSISFNRSSGKIPSKDKKRGIGDILEDIEKGSKTAEDAIAELNERKGK